MNITDRLYPMRGEFFMQVVDRGGKVLRTISEHNLIVNQAKQTLAWLISDPAKQNRVVSKFAVGTHMDPANQYDDFGADHWVCINNIVRYDYPGDVGYNVTDRVRFSWQLQFSEGNGHKISEFGLLCSDNTLFAHRVRDDYVYKADDISFQGTWTIIF